MDIDTENILRKGFNDFILERNKHEVDPAVNFLPYDFSFVDSLKYRALCEEMIKGELRELTNNMNSWLGSLWRWNAWNRVISRYGEEERWTLRREFLEALVHQCLFDPSAIRDTITFVSTNSCHQLNLVTCNGYLDFLEGDPKTPEEARKPLPMTRKNKEKRLAKLVVGWEGRDQFINCLKKIDGTEYKKQTSDYRNLHSHCIGPRQGIGMTRTVVRFVEQATELVKQDNGTYIDTDVSGKIRVSYGFGGTDPLDLEQARDANQKQYMIARDCYQALVYMLRRKIESSVEGH